MKKIMMVMLIVFSAGSTAAYAQMRAADMDAAKKLFSANSCNACHAMSARGLGPSIKEIAARYKGQNAQAALAQRIREGSQDRWGSVPHPVYEAMDIRDATLLAEWMLAGAS